MLSMFLCAVAGLVFPKRPSTLLPGFLVALWMATQVPALFALRVVGLYLLGVLACYFYWKNEDLLVFCYVQVFLASGFWAYHQYLGQDTVSCWVPLLLAAPAIYFRSLSVLGIGWLVWGLVEFYLTPSWLRIAPTLLPLEPGPPLPFQPLALGSMALLAALAARRKPRPVLILLLLLGMLPLTQANPGSVLSQQRVGWLVGNTRLQAAELPAVAARMVESSEPDWLAYSNNPENIRKLEGDAAVLFRQSVPVGSGRVYASHFNTTGRPLELVLELYNPGDQSVAFAFQDSSFRDPQELGTWTEWSLQSGSLASQAKRRFRLPLRFGNARLLTDMKLDGSLEMTLAVVRFGFEGALPEAVVDKKGSQSRGLFLHPSRRLEVEVALDDGPQVLTLDCDWLVSEQGDTLAGNYAVDTTVEAQLTAGENDACLILLVPTGGWAGTLGHCLHAYSGLVLFDGTAPSFSFRHHLTTNSYAPTRLLFVPYRSR